MDELETWEQLPGVHGADGRRPQVTQGPWRRRPPGWAIPLLAAFVALVVWAVGRTTGVELEVRAGAGTRMVGGVDVVVAALIAGLAGWGARALIRRVAGGPSTGSGGSGYRVWLVLAGAALLVSLLGPLGAVTPAAMGLLVAEHVAVGATVALGLSDRGRARRRTPDGPDA